MLEIIPGFCFPNQYYTSDQKKIFSNDLIQLLLKLHRQFEPERQKLLRERVLRQEKYNRGEVPEYPDRNSEAVTGHWKIKEIPHELLCRRVEITGPVNSAKMVINMLNRTEDGSKADMAMLDFEDSMKPSFSNVLDGYQNVISAVKGNLEFHTLGENGKPGKTYKMNPDDMAYIMVRVRGLHLDESNITIDGEPISAGLLDLVTCFFHTASMYVERGKTPKYYVPKCEHYLEARWWNKLFSTLEQSLGFHIGTLRATFLIETLPATFQIEEILYELRDHAVALNVGRWDKIFSDIKVLRYHPDRIMADRSSINMKRIWMENYAKRVIKICHERGALAMGGMSAYTPGKSQALREEQTRKVLEDKEREASWGHDGCWVSHPYFIGIAMQAFKFNNQLHQKLKDFDKYPDILPQACGPRTLQGLRTNLRVGLAYMYGWQEDIGCVAFDNLMEDLATLEISRAQVWQWLHHGITLDDGMKVTRDLVLNLINEEEIHVLNELQATDPDPKLPQKMAKSKNAVTELFLRPDLPEFLTTESERVES